MVGALHCLKGRSRDCGARECMDDDARCAVPSRCIVRCTLEDGVARMVRKQVYIEPEHDALLKRKARELGVTDSDLIRRGIEQIARTASPVPRDARAWDEE